MPSKSSSSRSEASSHRTKRRDGDDASRSSKGEPRRNEARSRRILDDDRRRETSAEERERNDSQTSSNARTSITNYRHTDKNNVKQDRSLSQPSLPPTGQQTHVPDQFPNQVPMEYSLPYRPGMTTHSSFGEATSYYGDQGESVAHQPGVRPGTPIIVGAEPHLLAASTVANPAQVSNKILRCVCYIVL